MTEAKAQYPDYFFFRKVTGSVVEDPLQLRVLLKAKKSTYALSNIIAHTASKFSKILLETYPYPNIKT